MSVVVRPLASNSLYKGRNAARRSGRGVSNENWSPGHSGVAIRIALPISSKGTRVGGKGCSRRTPSPFDDFDGFLNTQQKTGGCTFIKCTVREAVWFVVICWKRSKWQHESETSSLSSLNLVGVDVETKNCLQTVSYTHLTLPTILRV